MQTVSETYRSIWNDPRHRKEHRVEIAGVTYGEDAIVSPPVVSRTLFEGGNAMVGNCIAGQLTLNVIPQGDIPRMAEIRLETRLVRDVIKYRRSAAVSIREIYPGDYYIDAPDGTRFFFTVPKWGNFVSDYPLRYGAYFWWSSSTGISGQLTAVVKNSDGGLSHYQTQILFYDTEPSTGNISQFTYGVTSWELTSSSTEYSEWLPKGTFYIDTRKLDPESGVLSIHAFDAMLKADDDFVQPGDVFAELDEQRCFAQRNNEPYPSEEYLITAPDSKTYTFTARNWTGVGDSFLSHFIDLLWAPDNGISGTEIVEYIRYENVGGQQVGRRYTDSDAIDFVPIDLKAKLTLPGLTAWEPVANDSAGEQSCSASISSRAFPGGSYMVTAPDGRLYFFDVPNFSGLGDGVVNHQIDLTWTAADGMTALSIIEYIRYQNVNGQMVARRYTTTEVHTVTAGPVTLPDLTQWASTGNPDYAWPMASTVVVRQIANRMEISVDARTQLSNAVRVPYGIETGRELLGYIAAAHCGNWIMTDAGELRLVPLWSILTTAQTEIGRELARIETAPAFPPFSKVIVWYDDEHAFTAGDDTGRTLEVDLPFATQAIVDGMLERIRGYEYQPWYGYSAILDPAAELGDGVTVNGLYSVLASVETVFDGLMVSDAAAPEDEEVDHEYQFVSHTTRALRRKMTLGADYHGVSITPAKGLEVTQYAADGSAHSRAQLNGDVFAMYDDNGTARLYFDPETGRYKFVGDLDISGGSINMSGGTINWGGNNPAAGKLDENDYPYLHSTYIDEITVMSPTIVGGTIRATSDSEYYAEMTSNAFALMGEDYDVPRAAIKADTNLVEISLGVGDEDGHGRFYVRKGYGSVNGSATQNFALLQFNDANGKNSLIAFTDNNGIMVSGSPTSFFGTVDFSNADVVGLDAGGSNTLSGEDCYIEAEDDVVISAGPVVVRFDAGNERITFWFADSGVGWYLSANGLEQA